MVEVLSDLDLESCVLRRAVTAWLFDELVLELALLGLSCAWGVNESIVRYSALVNL